jgi:hypothetical protein
MFVSNFEKEKEKPNSDCGIIAFKAISMGIPVRIDNHEFIMVDKIYLRQPIETTTENEDCSIVETSLSQEDFIDLANMKMTHVESKAIIDTLSSPRKHGYSVQFIISSLRRDFIEASKFDLVIKNKISSETLMESNLDYPAPAKIKSHSTVSFKGDGANVLGSEIKRIDSVWHIDTQENNDISFIWGTGISISGDVTAPNCKLISKKEHDLDQNLSL